MDVVQTIVVLERLDKLETRLAELEKQNLPLYSIQTMLRDVTKRLAELESEVFPEEED